MEGVAMSQFTPSFWRNKRVFLTGHTGFKGASLALWLKELGAQVTGYSLAPNTSPSFFEACQVAQGMQSIIGDIRHMDELNAALRASQADVVLHLAAQSLVHYGYKNPVETYATNVMGTVNVLEAVRSVSTVKSVVIVTTDKCYENQEWHWGYRENEPMGGFDPYSSSKACAELVTAAYRSSYFNPQEYDRHGVGIASARAGNVIGGGDWAADRLIPDMVRAVGNGQPALIRRPASIRPWQHVLEPLAGYLLLAEQLYTNGSAISGAYNFGPNDQDVQPVQWIVEKLTKLWGEGASWTIDGANHPHEAQYLKLDCSKAKAVLGWQPRLSLSKALEYVVNWHKAYHAGQDMAALSRAQIANFLQMDASNS
jgi:CDP-glucose 4,6-dehydratase